MKSDLKKIITLRKSNFQNSVYAKNATTENIYDKILFIPIKTKNPGKNRDFFLSG
jgi:hypothetical protein